MKINDILLNMRIKRIGRIVRKIEKQIPESSIQKRLDVYHLIERQAYGLRAGEASLMADKIQKAIRDCIPAVRAMLNLPAEVINVSEN